MRWVWNMVKCINNNNYYFYYCHAIIPREIIYLFKLSMNAIFRFWYTPHTMVHHEGEKCEEEKEKKSFATKHRTVVHC